MKTKIYKARSNPLVGLALELKNISKSFGLIEANRDINLRIEVGTIHGIIGENGAGKSTLMNILYGLHRADSGKMFVYENEVKIKNPADALRLGIGMVHQHFMLVPRFSVLENVMLGSEGGILLKEGRKATLKKLKSLADDYGMEVDPSALVADLNVGIRQRVEILKALKGGAKILILDEPTGVLTPQEADQLFEILKILRKYGVTVLLITHKLAEIMAITDNVSIMRHGRIVGHRHTAHTSLSELAELMVGRPVLLQVEKTPAQPKEVILAVENLGCVSSKGYRLLDNLSFKVRSGEILGVAGVSGNGQTPLMEILSGMRSTDSGFFTVLQQKVNHQVKVAPREMRALGVGHIPEDRHKHGLILTYEAQENMILGYHHLDLAGHNYFLDAARIGAHCDKRMDTYDIRPANSFLPAQNFSGGNQQKIVIAREMFAEPKLLIIGQPTRGVDVGAIEFIHQQLISLRDRGCAILLISVELDEVMSLADRIMVLNGGCEVATVDSNSVDAHKLGLMMAGIKL